MGVVLTFISLCLCEMYMCMYFIVCKECSMNTDPDFDYCTPECRNGALRRGEFGIDTSALETSLVPVKIHTCQAQGCSNSVYWDYKTEFSYCSPKCRDNHMLEKDQRMRLSEIKNLEDQIVKLMKSTLNGSQQCKMICTL